MTLAIFDTSGVEPADQFGLFYEMINSQVVRLVGERPEGIEGFPARFLSHSAQGRSCNIIEAPSHSARRTLGGIKSSDPEDIHLNYMTAGKRHLRLGECETEISAGHVFTLDTRRPFELLGAGGNYRSLKPVSPAIGAPAGRSGFNPGHPEILRMHRLYSLLCATCGQTESGLGKFGGFEISMLMSVTECLFALIARQECPEAVDDWRHEIFAIINHEVERHLGDPEFDLDRLTHRLGVSRRYVQRVMARHDTTFSALLCQKRMEFARGQLASRSCKIEKIAVRSGYTELPAFYRAFKRQFGYAPSTVRCPGNGAPADSRAAVSAPPDKIPSQSLLSPSQGS
jgi:AraC-like DNA-binding protein